MTIARIGQAAPNFSTQAVVNGEFKQVSLSDYAGQYVVLFFYPLDFTFVCPTELIELSERVDDFKALNCKVLACSVDSKYSHLAWSNQPKSQGGIGLLRDLPILEDLTRSISKAYGVLMEDDGHSLRGTFIIDKSGRLRVLHMNDPPIGRSVDEILRLVEALAFTDEHGEVCPVNWKRGRPTMKDNPQDSKSYFITQYGGGSGGDKRPAASPLKNDGAANTTIIDDVKKPKF